ncbi:dipeptidase [Gammaproteobacteria bacterium]|nr:dipeptidase [Gammaproteobacteria bacterium]MDA8925904.1 dipeptidase [Gammaproteobacteria bacterium]MDA8999192.1 dipeptidase [Gammaproteobacteria bacterium]MDB4178100.1 dipeptidase [Gammaproteobacteria bacterium]MDC0005364.1 dipeptidase [Gammaproteobacteria bacterium]
MTKKILLNSLLFIVILVASALMLLPKMLDKSMNPVSEHAPFVVSEEAQALHNTLIVGDWHADSALWNRDLKKTYDYGHADIPRLQAGNVALQMFTTVTKSPSGQNYDSNETGANDNITALAIVQRWPIKTWSSLFERAMYQANKIKDLEKRDPENFMLIESQYDLGIFLLKRVNNPKMVGGLIGTEGSHALDGNLDNIERLYENSFRMMSLQHFFDNKLGGSLHGTSGAGLTEFGRQAIDEMQRLDIIIDVSHSSENVVKDVLSISNQPLVISHTGFNGYCKSPRNISDSLMIEIAEKGGLIGVGFWDAAVCDNTPRSVAEAIIYGIGLIGAEHVALGSDFDGTITPGFDTSELVAITHELLELGLGKEEIRKVMGENMLSFLQDNLPKT